MTLERPEGREGCSEAPAVIGKDDQAQSMTKGVKRKEGDGLESQFEGRVGRSR